MSRFTGDATLSLVDPNSSQCFQCADGRHGIINDDFDDFDTTTDLYGVSGEEVEDNSSTIFDYQPGDRVKVMSQTAGGWTEGYVVSPTLPGYITIHFTVPKYGGQLFRKHVQPTSKALRAMVRSEQPFEYDPGANFSTEMEAREALCDFQITTSKGIESSFFWEHKGNNAFKSDFSICGNFSISYNPRNMATDIVDWALKVHALPLSLPDEHTQYKELGFVHTLIHKKGEAVMFQPDFHGSFYLGLTIHKDLSQDLRLRMQYDKNGDRDYFERLFERFKETWDKRGDQEAETVAERADYLISYTGQDKVENDELLKLVATQCISGPHTHFHHQPPRRITFCTDRSLGFGVHFYRRGGSLEDDEGFTLKLGKHGFAQPLEDGTWWDEYKAAAVGKDGKGKGATKHGILILNLSKNYLNSAACIKEFTEIPLHKVWVLIKRSRHIVGLLDALSLEQSTGDEARLVLVQSCEGNQGHEKMQQLLQALKHKHFPRWPVPKKREILKLVPDVACAAGSSSRKTLCKVALELERVVSEDDSPQVKAAALKACAWLGAIMDDYPKVSQAFSEMARALMDPPHTQIMARVLAEVAAKSKNMILLQTGFAELERILTGDIDVNVRQCMLREIGNVAPPEHQWVEYMDTHYKRPYYHNGILDQTVWELPQDAKLRAEWHGPGVDTDIGGLTLKLKALREVLCPQSPMGSVSSNPYRNERSGEAKHLTYKQPERLTLARAKLICPHYLDPEEFMRDQNKLRGFDEGPHEHAGIKDRHGAKHRLAEPTTEQCEKDNRFAERPYKDNLFAERPHEHVAHGNQKNGVAHDYKHSLNYAPVAPMTLAKAKLICPHWANLEDFMQDHNERHGLASVQQGESAGKRDENCLKHNPTGPATVTCAQDSKVPQSSTEFTQKQKELRRFAEGPHEHAGIKDRHVAKHRLAEPEAVPCEKDNRFAEVPHKDNRFAERPHQDVAHGNQKNGVAHDYKPRKPRAYIPPWLQKMLDGSAGVPHKEESAGKRDDNCLKHNPTEPTPLAGAQDSKVQKSSTECQWEAYRDPKSGRIWYYNSISADWAWDLPPGAHLRG